VLNIEHHATIIKELSLKRALSHLGEATRQSGLNPGVSLSDGVAHVEEGIKEIREWDTFKDTKPMLLSAIVDENFGTLEKMASGEALMVGIPTGYPDLDEVTAGWVAGDMVVLAARPSVGKTALSLEFAHRQVSRGIPVFYVSLEMNRLQLLLRLICLRARVDSHALRHGRLDDTDRSKMFKAMTELREMPLWITDPTRLSSRDLVYRVRGMGEQHRVRLCVVDYLQLMVAATDKENRTQEVSQISRDCKEAAKILGKISDGTLIVLSQLTRLGNHERPQLHHLRESGEIEQNADVVMFIYNEKENAQLGQADPIPKKLDVQKQRNGITKTIDVVYLGQFNAFEPGESERPLFKD
jgi:replicative DNA helicase